MATEPILNQAMPVWVQNDTPVGGGATAAKQDTANTSLAAIDLGIPAALGSAARAASMPVTIAIDDTQVLATGAIADSAYVSGSGSIIALLKAIFGLGTTAAQTYRSDSFTPITTKTTTLIKSGAGTFARVIIQPGTADTLTFYDALTATGTPLNTLTIVATDRQIEYSCAFATGLTVVSGGTTAGNYCIVWR